MNWYEAEKMAEARQMELERARPLFRVAGAPRGWRYLLLSFFRLV